MHKQDTNKIDKEEEKLWMKDALLLNAKAAQVKNMMNLKFGKSVSTNHVRYQMSKLKGIDLEREELAAFLEQVEEEGGMVDVLLDKTDKVRGLSVQTFEMKKAYLSIQPDIVMLIFGLQASGLLLLQSSHVQGRTCQHCLPCR